MNSNTESRLIAIVALFILLAAGVLGEFFIAANLSVPKGGPINAADVAWIITASCFVLFMTPGLSFFYGGMVNSKNVVSTMFQSFICMGIVSLLWVTVGFSLCFGDSIHGLIGNPATFFLFRGVGGATHPDLSPTIPLALFALFQLKFCIITPALITGAFAERVRFNSYLLFIIFYRSRFFYFY
jgi:Amt family ammonium transporter